MRRTKIICTIGPASDSEEMLKELMLAGMNAARLNFSHGAHEDHKIKIDRVKKVRSELGLHVALLLDTKGPEIRTGKFEKDEEILEEGQRFTLTTEAFLGTHDKCSVSYKELPKDVKPGDQILIDDGLIALEVKEVSGVEIHCVVLNGGPVKDNKGINVPGVKINLPPVTEKDKADIIFGIENDIDYIAASFIRRASDVEVIRRILTENNGTHIKIISKIENKEGVDNIAEIIAASDGIMVARGDLGVEIPAEQVPIIQKKIIRRCNFEGKTVVTATQMLDSMIRNPRPTRAEVADVANAIFDGTDVIMLSGETASGKYPIEAVSQMVAIAETVECNLNLDEILRERGMMRANNITDAIGHATCSSANSLKATAILTPTASGYTGQVVAKFRPKAPIIAFTSTERIARRMALYWGVHPMLSPHADSEHEIFEEAINKARAEGMIENGDTIVITAGVPVSAEGNTNMLRIHIVGTDL